MRGYLYLQVLKLSVSPMPIFSQPTQSSAFSLSGECLHPGQQHCFNLSPPLNPWRCLQPGFVCVILYTTQANSDCITDATLSCIYP